MFRVPTSFWSSGIIFSQNFDRKKKKKLFPKLKDVPSSNISLNIFKKNVNYVKRILFGYYQKKQTP